MYMKKRVLFYFTVVSTIFSLQSCVTNYVVSAPATYVNEYNSDAKLASIDNKKLELAKKQLLSSFKDEQSFAANNLVNIAKNDHTLSCHSGS